MTSLTAWPNTCTAEAPGDHLYRGATWLLGRHPRLARLAARIHGVIAIDDGELTIDLDHLAEVISAVKLYHDAWDDYERAHHMPRDDGEYEIWQAAGPKADTFAVGLTDFLVMSSGEIASLRLLATLASTTSIPPFGVAHLRSLDREGQLLVSDWCEIVVTY